MLYRGSSSVLYAVLCGAKVDYLHENDFVDVDPLFELTSWRGSVGSVREMEDGLPRYATTTEDGAIEWWRTAADYVNVYTTPVDDQFIGRLLAELNLSKEGDEL